MSDTDAESWWVYVLLCANERLYVGIAKDVQARFAVHAAGKGAFYTRLNTPVRVLAQRQYESRSAALKAEYALKQLTKPQKLAWVASTACETQSESARPPSPPRGAHTSFVAR